MNEPFSDPQETEKYPLLTFQTNIKRWRCETCEMRYSQLIILNEELTSEKFLYMCEKCYQELHFDENGIEVFRNVKTFPYFND